MVRPTCNERPAGTTDTASASDRRAAATDAGVEKKVVDTPKAEKDTLALCELIAERLHLAAAWRDRPHDLFASKAMSCDLATSPQVCGRSNIDDGGFIGVGFTETGAGAFFHFQLEKN
jgi:hypothetical protein